MNLILALILAALAADCLINPLGMRNLAILRRDQAQIAAERDRMLAEKSQHEATIALLRSDDGYLQRMIREELGYVRSDELVYRFAGEQGCGEPEAGSGAGRRPSK